MKSSTTSPSSADSPSFSADSESASLPSLAEDQNLLNQSSENARAIISNLFAAFPKLQIITFQDEHVTISARRRLAHEVARPPQIAQQSQSIIPRKEP